MTIVEDTPAVTGVDAHADMHVAAALDRLGGLLGVEEFPATTAGYARLLGWLGGFGTVCLVGIEGTGSYGAGLARHVTAAGIRVVEVDRSDRQDRRRQGKSDPLDAVSAARAAQSGRAALAAQLADLRGQICAINNRLDQAGLHPGLNLAARFEDLAHAVVGALEAGGPRGPAAPYWIGLDQDTYHARLADLQHWADTVFRPHYGGYDLQECWPRHIHVIWELSTLAAEWHHTYSGTRPDLGRALEFYDRWLPGAMRRISAMTRGCMPHCMMLRTGGDWVSRPGYRLCLYLGQGLSSGPAWLSLAAIAPGGAKAPGQRNYPVRGR
jgi:Transposase